MMTRLPLRTCALLFGALSWTVLPASLSALPGPGGSHGSGASHGVASHSHGGSHGSYSSSSSSGGHYSGGAARSGGSGYSYSGVHGSAAPRIGYQGRSSSYATSSSGAGAGYNALSNFVAVSDADPARLAANHAALVGMAGHGWRFLPSSGISNLSTPARVPSRPMIPARSAFFPHGHLFHHHPVRPRLPYATNIISPYWGLGSSCVYNGFTSVCAANPYNYGFYGANYCLSGFGFWNCGYGLGYGYGPGYGLGDGFAYGPGPDYGTDASPSADTGAAGGDTSSYDDADSSNIYMGPLENPPAEAQPEPAAPRTPPTRIILKNGSAYEVTAYWVSKGELYYRPVTGGLSHVPADQLDLAATVQANSRNGVAFTLTDHPPQP